jgi:hypothetical protein
MMKTKPILISIVGLVGWSGATGTAHATHKSWVLKNSGGQCFFTSYSGVDSDLPSNRMEISNWSTSARYAICPLPLSARWGSSAGAAIFSPPRWARAMTGKAVIVNNNTAGSVFDCVARARLADESIYYSRLATTTTTGPQALRVAIDSDWAGILEAAEGSALKSLDFECRVPANNAGNPSYINGYHVKICQFTQQCNATGDDEGPPLEGLDFDGDYAYVQTNGFECMATDRYEADMVTREYQGIKNTASYRHLVFCPITPPADDSWWHQRKVEKARVYYKNSNGASSPAPECFLEWRQHSASLYSLVDAWSNNFVLQQGTDYVEQPTSTISIGVDVALGVGCFIEPNQTIKGVTARLSLTRITNGI